jgi:hypothetical protein
MVSPLKPKKIGPSNPIVIDGNRKVNAEDKKISDVSADNATPIFEANAVHGIIEIMEKFNGSSQDRIITALSAWYSSMKKDSGY